MSIKRAAMQVAGLGRDIYWQKFQPEVNGAHIALTDPEANHLLMVRHTYGKDKETWRLPGGGLNRTEMQLEATGRNLGAVATAKREAKEELGIEPDLNHLITYTTDHRGAKDTVRVFTGQITPGTELTVARAEIAAADWFSVDRLPKNIDPNTLLVRMALRGEMIE